MTLPGWFSRGAVLLLHTLLADSSKSEWQTHGSVGTKTKSIFPSQPGSLAFLPPKAPEHPGLTYQSSWSVLSQLVYLITKFYQLFHQVVMVSHT